MAGNITSVSFASPAALIAPDLIAEQQQAQRNQQLADALRQQALQGDQVPAGSTMSWTQGLSRLANALVSKKLYEKSDAAQSDMAQRYATSLRSMFGASPAGGAPPAAGPDASASSSADSSANGSSGQQALAAGVRAAAGVPQPPAAQPPQGDPTSLSDLGAQMGPAGGLNAPPPSPPVNAPLPAAPAAPSPAPAGGGAGFSSGPLSLTGNPGQDMAMYSLAPDEYMKGVVGAHAPTDFQKLLQASGVDPNSPLGKQLIQAQLAKQNYVAPVNGRPGSTIRDPYDPSKVVGYDLPTMEGAIPVYGPHGEPMGYRQAPGAAEATQAQAAAKAVGGAAPNLVQSFDPATGQMRYTPQLGAAGAAAGPPMGAQAAYNVTGTNSANAFQAISDGAADVPNRIYALKQMQGIVADPKAVFGPGSEAWNDFRGKMATLTGGQAPSTTNAQEFGKWAAQYSARSAQELGLSGSDARVQIAIHATPNGEMTRQALTSVIPQMVGLENAKQGYANAAVAWQKNNGPGDIQPFRTAWNANYDPRIYTWLASGTVKQNMAALQKSNPGDYRALVAKAQALGAIGALPQ